MSSKGKKKKHASKAQLPSRQVTVRGLSYQRREFQGPIPEPGTLAKFNDIIPNGADRIMAMAECLQQSKIDNVNHVLETKRLQVDQEHGETMHRQTWAGIIALAAIVIGGCALILSEGAGQWIGGFLSAAGVGPALYNLTVRYK